jgi:hypothetical protein
MSGFVRVEMKMQNEAKSPSQLDFIVASSSLCASVCSAMQRFAAPRQAACKTKPIPPKFTGSGAVRLLDAGPLCPG